VAASISLGAAACDEPRTQATEMVAPATALRPAADAGATADAARGPEAGSGGGAAADAGEAPPGEVGLILDDFQKSELPFVASRVAPGHEVALEIWVDDQGRVARAEVEGPELGPASAQDIERHLRDWKVPSPQARGRRFVLKLTAAELAAARPVRRPVPEPEMVAPPPRPVPRPEMIPPGQR
jgi:hypothetical protein